MVLIGNRSASWEEMGNRIQNADVQRNGNCGHELTLSCRQGSVTGPLKTAEATARVVDGSNGSKLKVTFFWPIEGDYWVLDRASDYSWSIVGEPSGRYLWILTRSQALSSRQYAALAERAKALGYNIEMLRRTPH